MAGLGRQDLSLDLRGPGAPLLVSFAASEGNLTFVSINTSNPFAHAQMQMGRERCGCWALGMVLEK